MPGFAGYQQRGAFGNQRTLPPLETFRNMTAKNSAAGKKAGGGQQANGGSLLTDGSGTRQKGLTEIGGSGQAASVVDETVGGGQGLTLHGEAQQYADTGSTSQNGDGAGGAPGVDEADEELLAGDDPLAEETSPGPVDEPPIEQGYFGDDRPGEGPETVDEGLISGGGGTAKVETNPLDLQYQKLLDEHDAGWDNIKEQVLDQGAVEERRFAERSAQSGFSAGGYMAGGEAELALGRVQTLANAKADHENQKRNLQLAWLEKRVDQNFTKEMNAEQTKQQLLFSILESGEPITQAQLDALIGGGILGEESKNMIETEADEGPGRDATAWDWNVDATGGISGATISAPGSDYVVELSEAQRHVVAAGLGDMHMPSLNLVGWFISKYKQENGGNAPSDEQVREHLREHGID